MGLGLTCRRATRAAALPRPTSSRSRVSWRCRTARSDRWPAMYPRILGRVERHPLQFCAQYASIFRLLLKVAVSVTHQCALSNFCKASCLYASRAPAPFLPLTACRAQPPPRARPPQPHPLLQRLRLVSPSTPCDRIRGQSKIGGLGFRVSLSSYLLSLLAMIKCSICSYQCDN